ncbi:MAG: glycosyltransferase [Bacteroidetes bacterium]|jgi:glycosyltransferase involved in cell wall biosynthesis|nr:glycosyltransferase [Bacteroidota bacterium]
MNLLVVSHACVTPVNQMFYAEVERQTGWDVTLVSPSTWETPYGTQTIQRWPAFDGALHALPVWLSGSVPLHLYRTTFLSLLRDVNPDAIYLHHEPYAAATGQVYLANRLTVGCPVGFFTWQNIRKTYPAPFGQMEEMVFEESDFAVSGSDSAREVLRKKGYAGPAPVIPAAVDPDRFEPVNAASADEQASTMPAADLPDAPVLIGFAGRIVREKGIGTFLKALARCRDLPWHFVLMGDGAHTDRLRRRASRLGIKDRVTFLGYVDHEDIPSYLSRLDLVVLPSETQPDWKEQFGRIIVEALASGTPVLGSDSGEIPHLIDRTGGGLTFAEGDARACAQPLRRLVRDASLRDRLAHRGRRYVLNTHTHEALADRFVETIRAYC